MQDIGYRHSLQGTFCDIVTFLVHTQYMYVVLLIDFLLGISNNQRKKQWFQPFVQTIIIAPPEL